jgi:L-rhamnose isomerase
MNYAHAKEAYAALGVDTEAALDTLGNTPVSLHCWQGDDVTGFESRDSASGGGIMATGNYPGRARTAAELRQDLEKVATLIPGPLRLNLHAIYADADQLPPRDELEPAHFQRWMDWAKEMNWGLDFNPTCFGHPMAADGFTLSNRDRAIRDFWIRHCRACRHIGAEMGRQTGTACVTNIWIPDGYKDLPVDRNGPRRRLEESLDAIFSESLDPACHIDAVESKLFGLGVESYTVGSHEFYLAYAVRHQLCLCLDAGHFHPTESIGDKISSVLQFVPRLLTHVSRGVRWDSDHVVILDDPTRSILEEIVRCEALPRTHLGLDFFDASINRIAAWTIGTRATQKALLLALLEPRAALLEAENGGDYTARLALLEAAKTLPWGSVWSEYCSRCDVPGETHWLAEVKAYERDVLSLRQ